MCLGPHAGRAPSSRGSRPNPNPNPNPNPSPNPNPNPNPNHLRVGARTRVLRAADDAQVPASGLGRRFSALGGPLEGWRVASKGLGPLPRTRGSTLAHGCGREGSGALPLPRAAAVSTGLRVRAVDYGLLVLLERALEGRVVKGHRVERRACVVGRAWWAVRVASRAPKRCSISRRDRDLATISRRAACWLRLAYSLRTQTPTQQPTSAPSEKMSVRSSMVESLGTSKSSGARYLYAGWDADPQPWEATGGLAGGFEAAGGAAQDEGKRPGPWLWQGGPRGAAAAEGGRRVDRLACTASSSSARRPPAAGAPPAGW